MNVKLIPLTILAISSLWGCTQTEENYFKLNWNVGEKKAIEITRNAKEFKDGKLTRDTTGVTINELTVAQADSNAYFVDYRVENGLVKYGNLLYENLKNEQANNFYIVLRYRIDRKTLKTELLNLSNADSLIEHSYIEILEVLKSKAPDKLSGAKVPFELLYQESKGFELETKDLSSILYSYNKKFVVGDTLATIDSLSNPFKLQKFAGAKVKSYISQMADKTMNITVDKTYDFATYKSMIKEMTEKMKGGPLKPLLKN